MPEPFLEQARLLDEMAPAFAYLRSHYEELRRRHPDQFVVVKDSTVLAANRSVDAVLQFLRREKIDERTVLIEFIPSEASSLVV